MLRFNTYRSKRYLRTKFVEGSYLLASEGTDLELELLDQMRRETQAQFGDVAINDAWKVERLSATQVLVKPGDAYYKGLLYSFRSGNDQLVTGAILSMGTVPVGVVASDDASGLGKIITFNNAVSTPTNLYKLVVTATEELITEVEDPFLKNSNLTEATAQKIRLVFKLNVVPSSLQTESPIPYRDENSTSVSVTNFPSTGSFASPNFVNQTTVTPTAAGNGELISLVTLSGSAGIDGRDIEIVLRNDPGIGGGIVLPNSPTAQQFYFNGKLIDSNGNSYHINAVFNDTVSTQVVLRLDKEPNQPNPEIVNTKPFTVVKRDVFVTDDTNGSPQGKLHWPIANIDFNSGSGILHQSKITDLRNSIEQVLFNQKSLNKRVNVVPVNTGNISFTLATSIIVTSAATRLFNGMNVADTLNATSYVLKDNSCLAFDLKYDGSILNKGNLAITIASVAGNDATLSSVNLSNVKLGNLVKDSAGTVFYITAIDDVNDIITLNGAAATGASTIYLDSFQEGYVKDDSHTYIFAVRSSNKIYIADLELEDGEISQIGDGVSQQLLTFIGATGESDSSPNYSSTNYIVDGDSLVTAIGKLDNAVAGAGGIKVIGGGTISSASAGGPPVLVIAANNPPVTPQPINLTNSTHRFARELLQSFATFDLAEISIEARTVGSPTGDLVMKVYSDSGGLPNTVLATSNTVSIATLTGTYSFPLFVFPTPPTLTNGVVYHYAIEYSGATISGSDYVQFNSESAAPPNTNDASYNGSIWSENGGSRLQVMNIYKVDVGTGIDLAFTSDMYLEIKGLAYTDNTIAIAESPIVFASAGQVAYVTPNLAPAGPTLTVTVGSLSSVPKSAIIIARREGTDIIVGSSSTRLKNGQSTNLYAQMSNENLAFIGATDTSTSAPSYSSNIRGTAAENLKNRIGVLTDAMGDAQEDRSAYLRSNDPVTWTGTQLQFTADIVLEIINTKSGTLKSATILVAGSPISLADNESAWVLIDRTLASQNVTVNLSGTLAIPAQTQANKDVIVIARRKDALGAGYVHIPLHKQVLEPGQTVRLGASGSGSGGGNEILETLKNHFVDATFDLLTPNIFKTDKATKVDGASTGAYSLVSNDFEYTAGGQTLVSTQMADAVEFLATTNALTQIELLAFWNSAFIDTAAIYEVSRNGGNAWQTVSMSRVGTTELYRAIYTFTDEVTNQTLFSQLTTNANRDLNATTQQEVSQPLVISSGTKLLVKDLIVALTKTGSPTGNLYVSICSDNSGDPNTILAESNAVAISGLVTGNNTIDLPDTYLAAGTYHIKFRTDATYKGIYSVGVTSIALQANSAGATPYARKYDGSVWSVASTDNLVYTVRGITIDLRVRITSSAGSKKLSGYGILYDKSVGNISTGIINREVFNFSGTSNLNEFTLTKFVPNPDLLKVYDVTTGQVYTYGAWSLQGQKVVFEVGQFNSPGNALTLVFDQTIGGAFDNSDRNGLLLANNFLGSTDGSIDKSQNGRGIFLRRPDGTLREIAIDNSDNIVVFSV